VSAVVVVVYPEAFRWNTDCSDLWDYPQTSQQRKQQPDSKAGQTKCEPYLEKEPGRRMGMEDRQYTCHSNALKKPNQFAEEMAPEQ
jgi:hypothetical protein